MKNTNIISFSKKIESIQYVSINYAKDNISLIGSKGRIDIYFNLPLRRKKKFFAFIPCKKDIKSTHNITLENFKTIVIDDLSQISLYTFFNNSSNKVYNEHDITLEDFEAIFIDDLSQISPYTFFNNYSNNVYNEIKKHISNSKNFQLYKLICNPRNPNKSSITVTGSCIYKIV